MESPALILAAFVTAMLGWPNEPAIGSRDTDLPVSAIRFFAADDETFLTSNPEPLTLAQQYILTLRIVSATAPALPPPSSPRYSEKFCFIQEDNESPIPDVPYFVESQTGMLVYGRSGENGCAARIYTPAPENLTCSSLIDAADERYRGETETKGMDADAPAPSPHADREGFVEKVCFLRHDRVPAANYPYFIASEEGYAIAGRTGEDGCAPEMYAPHPGGFTVYGGSDALRMNVNGPSD